MRIDVRVDQRTTEPTLSVSTTGPPALITAGFWAAITSVPRLSSRAEMPITAIRIAATSPTTTIFRWVVRSAVYKDEFMGAQDHLDRQANIVFGNNTRIPR